MATFMIVCVVRTPQGQHSPTTDWLENLAKKNAVSSRSRWL